MKNIFPKLTLMLAVFLAFGCNNNDGENEPEEVTGFSLSVNGFSEGNSTSPRNLVLTSGGIDEASFTVDYSLTEETADFGEDLEEQSGQITFEDGVGEVDITIIGDTHFELREQFVLTLTYEGEEFNYFIYITDDDSPQDILEDEEGYYTPSSYESMDLVWSDEFDGESLNEDDWTYELGDGCDRDLCGWGNNELQSYTNDPENVRLQDGKLTITAVKDDNDFTSARIITQDKVEVQYGRIDIRARMPKGQGIWPALWMLGANINEVSWPSCGEIDIMELVGHEPEVTHGTIHYDNGAGYASSTGSKSLDNEDFSDQFHVFSLVWQQNEMIWYVDYQQFKKFVKPASEQYPFNNEFFFIMNIAVGGNWPGNPDETTVFPQQMEVDYVRVFR